MVPASAAPGAVGAGRRGADRRVCADGADPAPLRSALRVRLLPDASSREDEEEEQRCGLGGPDSAPQLFNVTVLKHDWMNQSTGLI